MPAGYQCETGYTLDGTACGERDFTVACLDDGLHDAAPRCVALSCGEAPPVKFATTNQKDIVRCGDSALPEFAKQVPETGATLSKLNFRQQANFKCNPATRTIHRSAARSSMARLHVRLKVSLCTLFSVSTTTTVKARSTSVQRMENG